MARGNSFLVPAKSNEDISSLASMIHKFNKGSFPFFDVMSFVEKGLPLLDREFNLDIVEMDCMPDSYARTIPDANTIVVREDVYIRALHGVGRDRFTIAHELGHLLMHKGVSLARTDGSTPIYRDSEWQADRFASELLMPRKYIKANNLSVDEIMISCKVSRQAAEIARNDALK